MLATLRAKGSNTWQNLAGATQRVGRARSKDKAPLAKVLGEMEWNKTASGERLGLLSHFLKELRLTCMHPGDRAAILNKQLGKAGHKFRLEKKKLTNCSGPARWMGTKQVFRALYPLV